MDAYSILVILLSVLLAILLILTITIAIYVLKLIKTVRDVSQKAATVVESASSIRKFVSPAIIGRFVYEAIQKGIKQHDKKEK